MTAPGGELDLGRSALEHAEWALARTSFEAALEQGESAEAREGLGLALWFLGEIAEGIAARERAFELYAAEGRCDDAARVAVWVSHQHALGGRLSASRGWLARAQRVLPEVGAGAGYGWVAVELARHASDPEEQIRHAGRAVEIAREQRAGDLETFAVSVLGRAYVAAGRWEEGLLLLEEAMTGAVGGHVRNVHTLAEAYCNLIIASTDAGDWDRASEWCEMVDTFAREHDAAPLFGTCRAVHADVLLATGHWAEAERALETALATHARFVPEMGAPSSAALAELRIRQGRLSEATALLAGRDEDPSSLRALAMLRSAEGHPRAAVTLLERGLTQRGVGAATGASQLMSALVAARIASGDLSGAKQAADDLAELAATSGIAMVAARADLGRARSARAGGDLDRARIAAQGALVAFLRLTMPLEAAEARLELAIDEAQTALAVFRQLGATRCADSAQALLRELGRGTHAGRRLGRGSLTAREQEVLELVAMGLSNAGIAASLVISEKTAGHHVSRILAKLGVQNRTEAALHVADNR
jgi:ATP/maltotriose-dependent transcriptional regulator MalT